MLSLLAAIITLATVGLGVFIHSRWSLFSLYTGFLGKACLLMSYSYTFVLGTYVVWLIISGAPYDRIADGATRWFLDSLVVLICYYIHTRL